MSSAPLCTANLQFFVPRRWVPLPQNFDHTGRGLLTVFEIATGEMWPDIMYNVVDAVGPDLPMSADYSQGAAFYFM